MPEATHSRGMRDWAAFDAATAGCGPDGGRGAPATISYQKDDSGFFKIIAYNREADVDPASELQRSAAA